jgi:hypothetical protein
MDATAHSQRDGATSNLAALTSASDWRLLRYATPGKNESQEFYNFYSRFSIFPTPVPQKYQNNND